MRGQRLFRPGQALALAAVAVCLAVLPSGGVATAQTLRVLVAEDRTALQVASQGGLTITDPSGRRVLAQRNQGPPLHLLLREGRVLVREAGTSAAGVLVWPHRSATVDLDGKLYRGYLQVTRLNGALAAINVVELEDYLLGVLKDEIPPGWPAEAAKVMAVIARTYAVHQMQQEPSARFHLRATTASQVYGGATAEDVRTSWAVEVTRGEVLSVGGQLIPAFYHACSGGATEDAPDVFSGKFDTVIGVKDDFSINCPYALWVERLTPEQIQQGLVRSGYSLGRPLRIEDLVRSRTGRILRLAVVHTRGRLHLEGKRFREALGNDVIRSTDFEVRSDAAGFTFVGRGWGHGVGLSQWGAKAMAELAYQYRDILKFYYPLAEVRLLTGPIGR